MFLCIYKYWIYEHTICRRSISRALRGSRWLSIKTYITRCTMQNVIPSSQCVHGNACEQGSTQKERILVRRSCSCRNVDLVGESCVSLDDLCDTQNTTREENTTKKCLRDCWNKWLTDRLTDWFVDMIVTNWTSRLTDQLFFYSSGACRFFALMNDAFQLDTVLQNFHIFHFEEINTKAQFYYKSVKRCSKAFEFIINLPCFICNKVIEITTAKLTKWQCKHLHLCTIWILVNIVKQMQF